MNKVTKLLAHSMALVDDPTKWVKCSNATDVDNMELDNLRASAACKFCAWGAIHRAAWEGSYSDKVVEQAKLIMAEHIPTLSRIEKKHQSHHLLFRQITMYNDSFTTRHDDVMTWFDKAIESSKIE